MNFVSKAAKVFAFSLLLFVIANIATGQDGSGYVVPAGTRIRLRMEGDVGSKFSSLDDTFVTRVALPVMIRDVVAVPAGTVVEGRVTKVSPAAIGGRSGRIEVTMYKLRFANEATRDIEGIPTDVIRGKPARRIWAILGGTGVGAALGAVAGSTRGSLIGAGVGAGVGAGATLLTRGDDVVLKEDDVFEIELKRDVTLPVSDY